MVYYMTSNPDQRSHSAGKAFNLHDTSIVDSSTFDFNEPFATIKTYVTKEPERTLENLIFPLVGWYMLLLAVNEYWLMEFLQPDVAKLRNRLHVLRSHNIHQMRCANPSSSGDFHQFPTVKDLVNMVGDHSLETMPGLDQVEIELHKYRLDDLVPVRLVAGWWQRTETKSNVLVYAYAEQALHPGAAGAVQLIAHAKDEDIQNNAEFTSLVRFYFCLAANTGEFDASRLHEPATTSFENRLRAIFDRMAAFTMTGKSLCIINKSEKDIKKMRAFDASFELDIEAQADDATLRGDDGEEFDDNNSEVLSESESHVSQTRVEDASGISSSSTAVNLANVDSGLPQASMQELANIDLKLQELKAQAIALGSEEARLESRHSEILADLSYRL
ncbi:hypothetical protein BDV96DRAFT_608043 [Lophiotrema nucula]|uniref:Uncharacterized protein n=1 Tax=Lophiotrema nucula TaxID=690887 RepID=A0A6A5YEZ5_9PLEO|nr:hypothetical protein BDV96DRAFT_608043 [Lophiotrema nucula]